MTLPAAILESLEEIGAPAHYVAIYEHIAKNNLFDFGNQKTPKDSVAGTLVRFIQKEDSRIRRIKSPEGVYLYYLAKNERGMDMNVQSGDIEPVGRKKKGKSSLPYKERSLHKLLSSYLKNANTYSKTIYHEQSKHGQDDAKTWTHPDMVGVRFLDLKAKESKDLLKSVNKSDLFTLSSYELKTEIRSDSDLKRAYFQAYSNSSWANYGYLVALEFNGNLQEEMERLNQSFGIGIIVLDSSSPFRSKIIFHAKRKDLDFKTIDKLCNYSQEFAQFIGQTEKLLNAPESYYGPLEKEFCGFCDDYFADNDEAGFASYCKEHKLPYIPEG